MSQRNRFIKIRVSDQEREAWSEIADRAGRPLSDLIRERMQMPTVDAPRPRRRKRVFADADPALLRQLGAIGNNVNQLARAVNAAGPEHDVEILAALVSIEKQLRRLGGVASHDDKMD